MAGEKISDIADHAAFCDAVRDNLVLPEDVEFWVRVVNDEAPAVIDNSALTVIKETGGEFYETAMKVMTAKEEWDGLCRLVAKRPTDEGSGYFFPCGPLFVDAPMARQWRLYLACLVKKRCAPDFWPPLNMRPVRLDLSAIFFVLL